MVIKVLYNPYVFYLLGIIHDFRLLSLLAYKIFTFIPHKFCYHKYILCKDNTENLYIYIYINSCKSIEKDTQKFPQETPRNYPSYGLNLCFISYITQCFTTISTNSKAPPRYDYHKTTSSISEPPLLPSSNTITNPLPSTLHSPSKGQKSCSIAQIEITMPTAGQASTNNH